MLHFSIQNARGGRERLRGGLRTDGFMVPKASNSP